MSAEQETRELLLPIRPVKPFCLGGYRAPFPWASFPNPTAKQRAANSAAKAAYDIQARQYAEDAFLYRVALAAYQEACIAYVDARQPKPEEAP